jgi:predicted phage terminase large subunit-like protein
MVTLARAIFEILRNPNVRILIVSKTAEKANQFLLAIKQHLEHNELLRGVFGDYSTGATKWGETQITVPQRSDYTKREPTITASSVGGPVSSRGYDFIFPDDLVDEDNAYTEHQRERLKTWFYKVLDPCLTADGEMHGTGTRFHPLDLYGHQIKHELRDAHQVIDCYDGEGESIWPEVRPSEWLEEKRLQAGTAIFNSQYRNNGFRYYTVEQDWQHFFHFVGCDPAATRRSNTDSSDSDFWTIVVGAVSIDDPSVYLRYAWRGRVTKDEYLDKCQEVEQRYKPVVWGVENVAAQEYLAQDMEGFASVQRVERFTDKTARAYWLQPKFENGLMLFPDASLRDGEQYEIWQHVKDELAMFPKAAHDDLFDALEAMMEVCMEYRTGLGQHNRATRTKPMRESYDALD